MKNLFILISLSLFFATGCQSCVAATGVDKRSAELGAKEWAANMGMKNASVNCVNIDSDDDGYLSCTVGYKDEKGFHAQPLECAAKFNFNSGCRIPMNRFDR